MNKIKTKRKVEKGITLIALVITIIVLLILAGVSIAMLTGENGILSQAQKAKNETENAQSKEETTLGQYESYINRVTGNSAEVGKIVTGGNKPYTNNGTAIIPEGFAIVPGLDNVKEGLVISDKENDINNEGNQFVWVPVEDFNEFVRHDFANQGIQDSDFINTEITVDKYYEAASDGIANVTEAEQMYKSVKNNRGFYIGRYEAGKDGEKAISKKGADVYNNIKWGNSMIDENGGAVEKARNFDTQNKHTNITSTLVYGVQWDAIMRWLSKETGKEKEWLIDSSGKGNYYDEDNTNNPAQTGMNDNYQMKHIYDLAGNVWELTMESDSTNAKVERGGSYNSRPTNDPCSKRGGATPDSDDSRVRISNSFLFVKIFIKYLKIKTF